MTYEPNIWGGLLQKKNVLLCWKMTRNKTSLLCERAYKNRPKRKEAAILSSEQEMKVGFMVMTQEQSNSDPSGRVILVPSKRVEADEVRFQEHVVCFLEQWCIPWEGVFPSLPACESTVLHRSTEGFYGSCWEKMPDKWCTQDWLLHHDNMTTCHATRIHGFSQCLTKKRWLWFLASVLLIPILHGLFWFSKIETWLKGWRFKDIMKHWRALQNMGFRCVSSCGRDTG